MHQCIAGRGGLLPVAIQSDSCQFITCCPSWFVGSDQLALRLHPMRSRYSQGRFLKWQADL
jgi:hypothetical protein